MLLVVVKDLLHGLDTRILVSAVVLSGALLVPVEDTSDEGGDEGDLCLGAGDGLAETEEEGEVAVDLMFALELSGGLDTLPGGRDLDENSLFWDADGLIEIDQV